LAIEKPAISILCELLLSCSVISEYWQRWC